MARFALARTTDDREGVMALLGLLNREAGDDVMLAAAAAALATQVDDLSALRGFGARCDAPPMNELDRWRSACSKYRLAISASTGLNRCVSGCEATHVFPLAHLQGRPVVMVGLANGERVPFLVDTGAGTSVLAPSFLDQAQAKVVPGTEFEAGSSGGKVEAKFARVDLTLDGLQFDDVGVALIELPVSGIFGIISPHVLFSRQGFTLDFRKMEMTVTPPTQSVQDPSLHQLPLLMSGGNPHLPMVIGERQARPVVLDSGADITRIRVELDALGAPLKRKDETVSKAAGGEYKSWTTNDEAACLIGNISWTVRNPIIYQPVGDIGDSSLGTFGILGMDFLMGRRLTIDRSNRIILIDTEEVLPPWNIGDHRTLAIMGSHIGKPFNVREEVVERDVDSVTLMIAVEKQGDERRFRIQINDSWNNRSTWLLTRPAVAYWRETKDGLVAGEPGDAVNDWLPAFMSFQASGTNADLTFEEVEVGGQKSLCSRISMDATTKGKPARFAMWDCAGNVWRTTRLEVTDAASGELLWGFKQTD